MSGYQRTAQEEAAFDCGYKDEMSGAPIEASRRDLSTGAMYPHYSAGRQHALWDLIEERRRQRHEHHQEMMSIPEDWGV